MRLSEIVKKIAAEIIVEDEKRALPELWKQFEDTWSTRKDLSIKYFIVRENIILGAYNSDTSKIPSNKLNLKAGDMFLALSEKDDKVIITVATARAGGFDYPRDEKIVAIKEVYKFLDERDIVEISKDEWLSGGKKPTPKETVEVKDVFEKGTPANEALLANRNSEAMKFPEKDVKKFILEKIAEQPDISVKVLINSIVQKFGNK